SSRRRHTSLVSDWSSDVCSSDLEWRLLVGAHEAHAEVLGRCLDPVEAAQEVDVPPVAPELAVGDGLKPDRLLQRTAAGNGLVPAAPQRAAIDPPAPPPPPAVLCSARPRQHPTVVGP